MSPLVARCWSPVARRWSPVGWRPVARCWVLGAQKAHPPKHRRTNQCPVWPTTRFVVVAFWCRQNESVHCFFGLHLAGVVARFGVDKTSFQHFLEKYFQGQYAIKQGVSWPSENFLEKKLVTSSVHALWSFSSTATADLPAGQLPRSTGPPSGTPRADDQLFPSPRFSARSVTGHGAMQLRGTSPQGVGRRALVPSPAMQRAPKNEKGNRT